MHEALFLGVEDVEEIADVMDHFGRHVFWNVVFHEFLQLIRELADPLVAPLIVPLDDVDARPLLCILLNPFADGNVVCTGGDEFAQGRSLQLREAEEYIVQRAVEVLFADGAGEIGPAFVQGARGQNVAAEHGVGTAWEIFGQVGSSSHG